MPITDPSTGHRRISNSEVATWTSCQRKYFYAFDLALQPKRQPDALSLGILVHEALAAYYTDGYDAAVGILQSALQRASLSTDSDYSVKTAMQAITLFEGYKNNYGADSDWEVLAVEKSYDIALNEYAFAMKLDLLIREVSTGKIYLVDHKTTYDFWSQDDLAMSMQFPKYVVNLKHAGIDVAGVIINQIRKRTLKNPGPDDLFRRVKYDYSIAKQRNAMREQLLVSDQIMAHRSVPIEVREVSVARNMTKLNCNYCAFKDMCLSEFDGGSRDIYLQTSFEPSTYAAGYNPPTTEEL